MKALIFTPTPSHPFDQGNKSRIYQVCKGLKAAGYEVWMVLLTHEGDWRDCVPVDDLQIMEEAWDRVFVLPGRAPVHPGPVDGAYHTLDAWWDPDWEGMLSWLFQGNFFELMVVEYTYLSKALEFAPAMTLKMLDTIDLFSRRKEMLASICIAPEFYYCRPETEALALARADGIVSIKPQEAQAFARLCDKPIHNLGFHLDEELFTPPPLELDPASGLPAGRSLRFGFMGVDNSINLTNCVRFLDRLIARLRYRPVDVEIHIYGTLCRNLSRYAAYERFIKLNGFIEDKNDFYDAVDCLVFPLFTSSGLKIKVGEALAKGRPILGTRHAFEGYPNLHPLHDCVDEDGLIDAIYGLAEGRLHLQDMLAATTSALVANVAKVEAETEALFDSVTARGYDLVCHVCGPLSPVAFDYLIDTVIVLGHRPGHRTCFSDPSEVLDKKMLRRLHRAGLGYYPGADADVTAAQGGTWCDLTMGAETAPDFAGRPVRHSGGLGWFATADEVLATLLERAPMPPTAPADGPPEPERIAAILEGRPDLCHRSDWAYDSGPVAGISPLDYRILALFHDFDNYRNQPLALEDRFHVQRCYVGHDFAADTAMIRAMLDGDAIPADWKNRREDFMRGLYEATTRTRTDR